MRTILHFAAAVACLTVALTGHAQSTESSRMSFHIEAQPLSTALNAFSRQSGLQVMRRDEDAPTEGLNAPRVVGQLSVEEALTQLLINSGLEFQFVNDKAVAIRSLKITSGIAGDGGGTDRMQLAQGEVSQGSTAPADETDGEETAAKLEEVVVTAQKREERLKDVPISISVLTGADLDKSPVEGVTEALNRVPSVATSPNFQGGGTLVAIRGAAAGGPLFKGASPAAYYLDSVPFGLVKSAIAPDSNAYDLERVEVLRGPQGTLYGANAQNGVVRVLTHDADLDAFEFKARTSASSTDEGGENYRADAALNIPLIEGKLGVRAVVGYQDLSGWIDKPGDEDANDAELRNLRLKINAQPTEALSIGLAAWISRSDFGAPPMSADGHTNPSAVDESTITDYDAYGLKIGYDFAGFSLTTMTSHLDFENGGPLDISRLAPGRVLTTILDAKVLSEELILNSNPDSTWRWSLGGFYRDGEDRTLQTGLGTGDETNSSESFAAFGEAGRRFLDERWEWTLGLRYFHDRVGFQENINSAPGVPRLHTTESFDSTTPRAVLTWYPNSNITAYGSYSEGFRSGANQPGAIQRGRPDLPAAEPDKLHNYELGAKAELLDRQLSLDAAVYYMDWNDVQQSINVALGASFIATLINTQSASGIGADLGATIRPLDGLELGMSASWNDLQVDADVISQNVPLYRKGDRLNASPEWTAGASLDYVFALGGTGFRARLGASGNYISEQDLRTTFRGATGIGRGDPILLTRASFSIESEDRWTVTVFGENLNDERGAVTAQGNLITDWTVRVRPRTIGVQLEYRL
jgi:iron complex outermembrane recepter protein